jgi:hypothetical protein
LRRPMARPPRMTVKLSHERKVRSLAKKTFGSTRVGRAMRFPVTELSMGCYTGKETLGRIARPTWCGLEERLARHGDDGGGCCTPLVARMRVSRCVWGDDTASI